MFYNKKQLHTDIKRCQSLCCYEITNFHGISRYPTLANALFGAVKLTKNTDIDKCKYSLHGIGFDGHGFFSHTNGGTRKDVIIFGVDMNSSTRIDNKEKTF